MTLPRKPTTTFFEADVLRGTGRTSMQMMQMPRDGVFVWCNDYLSYPKDLAKHLGRADILIWPARYMGNPRAYLSGVASSAVVLDHAIDRSRREVQEFMEWALISMNYCARDRSK